MAERSSASTCCRAPTDASPRIRSVRLRSREPGPRRARGSGGSRRSRRRSRLRPARRCPEGTDSERRTPSSCWCALLGTLAAAITNPTQDLDQRHREGPVDSPCPLPLTPDAGPSAHEPAGARVGVSSSTFPFVHDRQESSGDSWRTRHGSWGGVPSEQPLQEMPTDVRCSTTPAAPLR